MSKNNTVLRSLQLLLSQDELQTILEEHKYWDPARKLTVSEFLKFSVTMAIEKWNSYRESEDRLAVQSDIVRVDHTTLAKKAKDLPFSIFKEVFHRLVQRCNRQTRRELNLPISAYATDSTTITVGEGRLPWAAFHGGKSGIKLHVRFHLATKHPCQVEESIARKHDSPWAEKILPSKGITVYDRGYLDLGRLDGWEDQGHLFVVRLRDNTVVSKQKGLKRLPVEGSNVVGDASVLLGRGKKTRHRFRMVTFRDGRGKPIRVVTNLWNVSAETIATLYKERWQVELFFRWIKQHLHVKKLFGTSQNAVYNQLYGAFIAYLLLNWLYQQTQSEWRTVQLSFIHFVRKLCWRQLPTEVELSVYELLDRYR